MKVLKRNKEGKQKEEPLQLEMVRLEAIAETMQEHLYDQDLVQDREHRAYSVPQAFTGKDAVTVLVELLERECAEEDPLTSDDAVTVTVTREQALQVGRDIAREFQFFSHAKNTNKETFPLEDTEKDMYKFQDNLPLQVHMAKTKYPSTLDRIRLLEEQVTRDPKDKDCFQAKDAVDVFMRTKLVKSRHHAVHLVQKINEKVGFCRLAKGTTRKFEDNDKLWRFLEEKDWLQVPRRKSSRSPTRRKSSSKSLKGLRTTSLSSNRSLKSSTGSLASFRSRGSTCSINSAASGGAGLIGSQVNATFDTKSPSREKKDKQYFKDRALDVRKRLDVYRDQRSARSLASNNSSFASLDTADLDL